jgi:hypothetical protein
MQVLTHRPLERGTVEPLDVPALDSHEAILQFVTFGACDP